MPCTLDFPATYPTGRPAFFAQRFMAHVLRRGLAFEVGSDAIVLLLAVVSAEDRTRYTKAVGFWNDHLMSLTGLSRAKLFAARQKLVDRGWMVYFAGARGRAPLYFVAVPGGDERVNAAALGETDADEVMLMTAEAGREKRDEGGEPAVSEQPAVNPSGQLPSAISHEPAVEADSDQTALRQSLRERIAALGVDCPDCLERAERVSTLAEVAAVVEWAESRAVVLDDGRVLRPWVKGAVFHRLVQRGPAGRAATEGWVAEDPEWAKAWERSEIERKRVEELRQRQVEAEKKQAEEDLKRRGAAQLEFSWGVVVDRVANEPGGCERLFDVLLARSAQLERWARRQAKSGEDPWHSAAVRPVLLRAAEQGLIG